MTDREIMEQALDALEEINKLSIGENAICLPAEIDEAMDALRERLAQPEQEPVVWMYQDKSTHEVRFQKHMSAFVDHSRWTETPLYSEPLANHELNCVCGAVWCGDELVHLPRPTPQPRQWQGLTVAQIEEAFQQSAGADEDTHIRFARAIEAKLKEKHT